MEHAYRYGLYGCAVAPGVHKAVTRASTITCTRNRSGGGVGVVEEAIVLVLEHFLWEVVAPFCGHKLISQRVSDSMLVRYSVLTR